MNYTLSPRKTIIIILFVSVIMDIVYGILEYIGLGFIVVSLLFRLTILAAFFVVLLRTNDAESWFVKGLLVFSVLCVAVWAATLGALPLVLDMSFYFKTVYPMCIGLLIYNALLRAHQCGESVEELLITGIIAYGLIASVSIVFSLITGIGRMTYGEWAFGIKSFFTGGNDIGLTMLVSLSFAWARFWKKETLTHAFHLLLLTFAISLIGSRGAFGGVVGVTVCFSLAYFIFKKSHSHVTSMIKVSIIVVVVAVGSFATKIIYDNFDDLSHNIDRVVELFEGVNPRAYLDDAGYAVLKKRDVINDVFGQGTTFFYQVKGEFSLGNSSKKGGRAEQQPYKAIEQDLIDLYGMYGALLGGAFILYHICYWLFCSREYWLHRNIVYFACLISVSMFLFHGFLAGHALSSPQVCTLIGSVYGYLRFKNKTRIDQIAATQDHNPSIQFNGR